MPTPDEILAEAEADLARIQGRETPQREMTPDEILDSAAADLARRQPFTTSEGDVRRNESHPKFPFLLRLALMNYIDDPLKGSILLKKHGWGINQSYLQKEQSGVNFAVKPLEEMSDSKKPFYVVDPYGFDPQDFTDIIQDVLKIGGEVTGAIGGAAAGATVGAPIKGAIAGAGGMAGYSELIKQWVQKKLGVGEISALSVGGEAAVSAGVEAAVPGVSVLGKATGITPAIKEAAKKAITKTKPLIKKAWEGTASAIGEALGFPKQAVEISMKYTDEVIKKIEEVKASGTGTAWEDLADKALDSMNKFGKGVSEGYGKVFDAIIEKNSNIKIKIDDITDGLRAYVAGEFASLSPKAKGFYENLIEILNPVKRREITVPVVRQVIKDVPVKGAAMKGITTPEIIRTDVSSKIVEVLDIKDGYSIGAIKNLKQHIDKVLFKEGEWAKIDIDDLPLMDFYGKLQTRLGDVSGEFKALNKISAPWMALKNWALKNIPPRGTGAPSAKIKSLTGKALREPETRRALTAIDDQLLKEMETTQAAELIVGQADEGWSAFRKTGAMLRPFVLGGLAGAATGGGITSASVGALGSFLILRPSVFLKILKAGSEKGAKVPEALKSAMKILDAAKSDNAKRIIFQTLMEDVDFVNYANHTVNSNQKILGEAIDAE